MDENEILLHFEQFSGSTALTVESGSTKDSSGSGFNARCPEGRCPTLTEGRFGTGMYFSGSTYFDLGTKAGKPGNSSFSYGIWFKEPSTTAVGVNRYLVSRSAYGPND